MPSLSKQRRPIGMRNDPDQPAPSSNLATFLYREDALAAGEARFGCRPNRYEAGTWNWHEAYSGYDDRWVIKARRKSWAGAREVYLLADGELGQPLYES